MKEVTLEQVKEHFKYAKEVRCVEDGKAYVLNESSLQDAYLTHRADVQTDKAIYKSSNNALCLLYDKDKNQFAPIISYIFERGEEVEVSDNGKNFESINFFVGLTKNGNIVGETTNGRIIRWNFARKLSPETQLQPQIDALTEEAKKLGIEITFKILK
jgi:hypothetical protein